MAEKQIDTSNSSKLKAPELSDFCRQLGTLLSAGVSLVRALSIMEQEEGIKPKQQAIYNDMMIKIRQGIALSDTMEQQGRAFPDLLISMIRSAEASGTVDLTCSRMAEHYTKEHKLNAKVKNAMIYPAILAILMVAVVIFVVLYILPQFQDMFDAMDSLPLPTVILFAISDTIKNRWYMIIAVIVIVVVGLRVALTIPQVRWGFDMLKLRMPAIGKLLETIYTARFARTLSSLYGSGLSMIPALTIGRNTVGNTYITSQFDGAIAMVQRGESLSGALGTIDGFKKKLPSTIMIGEETGSLNSMLDSIADSLDFESDQALSKLVAILEPAMIVVMALMVGFVMIAVIMPIYGSYSTIG